LHDQVGQNLTALGINLNIVQSLVPEGTADAVCSRLDDSLSLLKQTTQRIRDVMADLQPPVLEDYGLMTALRWYGAQFASRAGIPVDVQGDELAPRLSHPVESVLFRIAQEALTNVARYAQATRATVTVTADEGVVRLVVSDDGVGFDPVRAAGPDGRQSWGLLTMAERTEAVGGRLWIDSDPKQGTQVVVEVAR
jgi:signal transduction histidine kinase